MTGEYIGIDKYGRKMFLYHTCNTVYCDHVKNDKVVKTNKIKVENRVILMFDAPHTSGAYIYDEIKRRYGKSL